MRPGHARVLAQIARGEDACAAPGDRILVSVTIERTRHGIVHHVSPLATIEPKQAA